MDRIVLNETSQLLTIIKKCGTKRDNKFFFLIPLLQIKRVIIQEKDKVTIV